MDSERHDRNRSFAWVFIALCLVIIMLIACVAFCYKVNKDCMDKVEAMNDKWLGFISQYDFESYSYDYSQDGKGLNIIGDNNGVDYGAEIESQETGYAP